MELLLIAAVSLPALTGICSGFIKNDKKEIALSL